MKLRGIWIVITTIVAEHYTRPYLLTCVSRKELGIRSKSRNSFTVPCEVNLQTSDVLGKSICYQLHPVESLLCFTQLLYCLQWVKDLHTAGPAKKSRDNRYMYILLSIFFPHKSPWVGDMPFFIIRRSRERTDLLDSLRSLPKSLFWQIIDGISGDDGLEYYNWKNQEWGRSG